MAALAYPYARPWEIAVGLGLVATGVVAATVGARLDAEEKARALPCGPYAYGHEEALALIDAQIEQGLRDPALIATNTATSLYSDHPSGAWATFPPGPGAPAGAECVWERIVDIVEGEFDTRGLRRSLVDDQAWRLVDAGGADLEEYPWAEPVLDVHHRPAPGTWYIVDEADSDATVFRNAVAVALQMAGVDPAIAYDGNSRVGRRLRREMRELVLCSPINDARITSHSVELAGGSAGATHVMGPRGRGLVWAAVHHDDVGRIAEGLPPKRGVMLDGTPTPGARSRMAIYFPAINLAALRGPEPRITTEDIAWPDGSSTLDVPPILRAVGVDPGSADLGQPGCVPAPGVG